MQLVVRGGPEVILFLVLMVAYFLIMYLVVSAVLTNSGLKSEINNLKNEILDLKKLLNEKTKNITDDSNKDN